MTETNAPDMAPEPAIPAPAAPRPRSSWSRSAVIGAALVAGVALGAGGLAAAAAAGPGHFGWDGGPRLERIQKFVRGALDGVGANSDQEARIHDLIAKNFDQIVPERGSRMAMHKQVIDLLKAPTLDKAAIEKLRADQVAAFDAKSKVLVDTVVQAAEILTPDQRTKLAERAERFSERGPWGRWHHGGPHRFGPGGNPDQGPGQAPGPDGPDSPDDGGPKPDNG